MQLCVLLEAAVRGQSWQVRDDLVARWISGLSLSEKEFPAADPIVHRPDLPSTARHIVEEKPSRVTNALSKGTRGDKR